MPQLIVARDGRVEHHVELGAVTLTIGRDPSNHLPLVDPSRGISRFHAEVRYGPAGYTMVDRGTPNGMLVNGVPVRQVVLAPGVHVVMGPYSLEYVAESTAETNPARLGTRIDPNARRFAGRAAPIMDTEPVPAGWPAPPPMRLPVPRWTKTQKRLLVFVVTVLLVIVVGLLGQVLHGRATVDAQPTHQGQSATPTSTPC